jgi:hypothetical protein
MSDRPSAANGKRNHDWGTLCECPVCGHCLCYGCHPSGPCLDDARPLGDRRARAAALGPVESARGALR